MSITPYSSRYSVIAQFKYSTKNAFSKRKRHFIHYTALLSNTSAAICLGSTLIT